MSASNRRFTSIRRAFGNSTVISLLPWLAACFAPDSSTRTNRLSADELSRRCCRRRFRYRSSVAKANPCLTQNSCRIKPPRFVFGDQLIDLRPASRAPPFPSYFSLMPQLQHQLAFRDRLVARTLTMNSPDLQVCPGLLILSLIKTIPEKANTGRVSSLRTRCENV